MAYTPFQLQILAISGLISSLLSICGSSFVICQTIQSQHLPSEFDTSTKLILGMCIGEVLGTIGYGQVQLQLHSYIPCQIQAILIQFGQTILDFSLLGLTYVLWSNVSDSYVARRFKLNFTYWITFTVLLGASFVFIALEQHAMGPAVLWCWIEKSRSDLRLALFFIPLWITFIISVTFTALFVRIVYRVEVGGKSHKDLVLTRSAQKYLYGVFFVIIWIPGTVNRAYEGFYGQQPPFILPFLHTLFTPSQGFWNAVAYYLVNKKRIKRRALARRQAPFKEVVLSSPDSTEPKLESRNKF